MRLPVPTRQFPPTTLNTWTPPRLDRRVPAHYFAPVGTGTGSPAGRRGVGDRHRLARGVLTRDSMPRTRRRGAPAPVDPPESARAAGLRYVSDASPGIRREMATLGWVFKVPDGTVIDDEETLARIRSLAIPPAWTDVWICPIAERAPPGDRARRARPQAVPLSPALARGARRDEIRPDDRVRAGPAAHPRDASSADLAQPGLPREKVLAAVVRLLEKTLIRVGNEEYARENESFGLTTMRDRHVDGRRLDACASSSAARAASRTRSTCTTARLARDRQAMPRPARPRAVPVPRRGRRAADDRFGRRERLPARDQRARTSRRRTSAPGRARCSPRGRCGSSRPFESAGAGEEEHRRGRSSRWPSGSATPERSAASATSTRRSSTPIWMAPCSTRWNSGPMRHSPRLTASARMKCRC